MKLIIDIPEEEYEEIIDNKQYKSWDMTHYERVIADGTPIPDNATNGDIVQMMFPNVNVYEHNGGATYSVNNEYNFNATWWNAPYQKGGNE